MLLMKCDYMRSELSIAEDEYTLEERDRGNVVIILEQIGCCYFSSSSSSCTLLFCHRCGTDHQKTIYKLMVLVCHEPFLGLAKEGCIYL
ncbi:hypothetical protein U1Q18_036474 [Sarracenia purpurea var. burkii]